MTEMKAVFRCTEVEDTGIVLASARLDEEPPVEGLGRTAIIISGRSVLELFRAGNRYLVWIIQEESTP